MNKQLFLFLLSLAVIGETFSTGQKGELTNRERKKNVARSNSLYRSLQDMEDKEMDEREARELEAQEQKSLLLLEQAKKVCVELSKSENDK
ncbi:MAG: hypothetical protein ACJAZS_000245 [Alteromonas naphthalenivorans]|jgi:hypothetical protein